MSDALSVVARQLAEVTEELADRTEQVADLRKSQRIAELRAMRVLVDALELRMKQTLEAGSAPGTASILDAFLDGLDSDAQLASLLEEADRNDKA